MSGLPDFDWNLLKCLEALLAERNVTRAAARVGLSQPAMSRALGRLREVFQDQLFVRVASGVAPTERALELASMLTLMREEVDAAVSAQAFQPAESTRTFIVYGADFAESLLVPELMKRLKVSAPGISVHFHHANAGPVELLQMREVDLVLNPQISQAGASIMGQKLFDEEFACIFRDGHPRIKQRLSLAQFCACEHLLIAPRGRPGSIVDRELSKRNLSRRVTIQVPSFLSAPLIVSNTDIITTLPRRHALLVAKILPLRVLPPPLPLPGFSMMQYWHPRKTGDPAHQFLRATMLSVAAEL